MDFIKETSIKEVEFHRFAHEVKNPLAICNGYLEIIKQHKKDHIQEYLEIIQEEINRSLSIINDYSKAHDSKWLIEELDINCLLEEVIHTYQNIFLENNGKIILLGKGEYYYHGDYEKLKQVFMNIIKNAYEAKEEKQLLVVVQILSYKNYYQIIITDNGIGMDWQELEKVGSNYYTTKENGTGLGVSFCKDVILKHRGNIFYQSKKHRGTRVIITLLK